MSTKTIRCDRCNTRCRNMSGWNADLIAGLIVGHLCPSCQTPQEDLDAELNLITTGYAAFEPTGSNEDVVTQLIYALVGTYPTPEIMRHKATRLAQARSVGQ